MGGGDSWGSTNDPLSPFQVIRCIWNAGESGIDQASWTKAYHAERSSPESPRFQLWGGFPKNASQHSVLY